jgi:hypothetical protein
MTARELRIIDLVALLRSKTGKSLRPEIGRRMPWPTSRCIGWLLQEEACRAGTFNP